jgi:hypothetical protein
MRSIKASEARMGERCRNLLGTKMHRIEGTDHRNRILFRDQYGRIRRAQPEDRLLSEER